MPHLGEDLLSSSRPVQKAHVDFPTQGREVTIRHLLTHTSGIKSYTGLGPDWQKTVPLEMTHDELLGQSSSYREAVALQEGGRANT